MKQLFLCERPYPMFRTLVRAIRSEDDIDIALSARTPGLLQMAEPLRQSGIFRKVFVYEDPYYADFQRSEWVTYEYARTPWEKLTAGVLPLFRKFFAYTAYQRRSKKLTLPEGMDLSRYDEIYVDELPSGLHFHLMHQKLSLVCVEHGKNAFQNYQPYPHTRLLIALDKAGLVFATRGCSRRYRAVEVSNDNGRLLSELGHQPIRELSLDDMVAALTQAQGEKIFQIYCQAFAVRLTPGAVTDIYLTTPIYHRTAYSEAFQTGVFRHLVEQYSADAQQVILKPHPMDPADYRAAIPGCVVIPPAFSAEVFALSDSLRLRRAVTLESSTIASFRRAEETIELGLSYLSHFDAEGRYLPE